MKRNNMDLLDFFKYLAALVIVFFHYQHGTGLQFSGLNFWSEPEVIPFYRAVEFFFIVSGFLTAYTDRVTPEENTILTQFGVLKRKLLRIYPMAAIACTASLLAELLAISQGVTEKTVSWVLDPQRLIESYLLVFSGWPKLMLTGINDLAWYLCVLIQCYLGYAFVTSFADRFKIRRIILLTLSFIGSFIVQRYIPILSGMPARGYYSFLWGCVLASAIPFLEQKLFQKGAIAVSVGGICFSVLAIAVDIPHYPLTKTLTMVFILFPMMLLLAYASREIDAPWMRYLGRISFCVFLFHNSVILCWRSFCSAIGKPEWVLTLWGMLLVGGLTTVLSMVLYGYVEVPIGKAIRNREKKRQSAR